MASAPFRDPEPRPLPQGELIGALQWHDASGEVKRWTILQGRRANSIRVRGMQRDHGWDYVLRKLRGKLAIPRRFILKKSIDSFKPSFYKEKP